MRTLVLALPLLAAACFTDSFGESIGFETAATTAAASSSGATTGATTGGTVGTTGTTGATSTSGAPADPSTSTSTGPATTGPDPLTSTASSSAEPSTSTGDVSASSSGSSSETGSMTTGEPPPDVFQLCADLCAALADCGVRSFMCLFECLVVYGGDSPECQIAGAEHIGCLLGLSCGQLQSELGRPNLCAAQQANKVAACGG